MGTESYKDWLSLYNESLDKVWKEVPRELRKLSMLSAAYEYECNRLSNNLKSDIDTIQNKIKLKEKLKMELGILNTSTTKSPKDSTEESPNVTSSSLAPITNNQNSSDKTSECLSPTLNKFKNSPILHREGKVKSTQFMTPDLSSYFKKAPSGDELDDCVIDCTPDAGHLKNTNKLSTNKKGKEGYSKKNPSITKFFESLDSSKKSYKNHNNDNSFMEQGIWPLDEGKENKSKMKPTISRSTKLNYEDTRLKEVENNKLRGKSRKILPGWSCKECEMLYELMDLSEEEKCKKMNECSKHRYKYGPQDDTIAGFWDMNMDTQK